MRREARSRNWTYAGSQSEEVDRIDMASTSRKTLAAVFDGPESLALVERPLPDPGPGEVRIRLEGCGVCGSNLPVWEGRPWFSYPMEAGSPGHEGWGTIDAIGAGVSGPQPGDRVAALSYHAFSTHDIAPADAVVTLPEDVHESFPGEPLACAVNVMHRAAVEPGETVAIIGVGFLGALLTDLAAMRGARVIAVSRRRFALDMAREAGAEMTVAFSDPTRVSTEVHGLAPDGCDCVIEAVGNQAALDVASALVRTRGRLIIAGYHQDGPRQVNMQDWNWKGIDVINAHERDPAVYTRGLREAVELVATGRWQPGRFVTHRFPLEDLSEALRMMQRRPDGFLKALVTV